MTDHMVFEITWAGPGKPSLVQLVDNSAVIALVHLVQTANSVKVTYDTAEAPMHHIEWVFTFFGQALNSLKATVVENDDPTHWPLRSEDSAKNSWNRDGHV